MEKTAVIFDLDGTLLDSLEDLLDATNYALALHGYPLRTLEQHRQALGNGARTLIRRSLPEGTPEEAQEQVFATYKPYYRDHCRIKTRPYDGVLQALAEIAGRHPVAIVSNKPDDAAKKLCAGYFPGVYTLGQTENCPRKPAADMVLRTMAHLGVEKAVYVGDTEVDVQTARNAGIPCLSVLWGFRTREQLEQAGADHFCLSTRSMARDLEELIHGK